MSAVRGSCLCGGVKFEITGPLSSPLITGRLDVWRTGKTSVDMQLAIERGAGLAIKETATESLRVVFWEPWRPRHDGPSHGRVSYRRVQPRAAADETQVSEPL